MAFVNKASLREEFNLIKEQFNKLQFDGKVSGELNLLIKSMFILFEVMISGFPFLEKKTRKIQVIVQIFLPKLIRMRLQQILKEAMGREKNKMMNLILRSMLPRKLILPKSIFALIAVKRYLKFVLKDMKEEL